MPDDDPVRVAALRNAGGERLLTPEELVWKTESITGYSWGRGRVNAADAWLKPGIDYSDAHLAPGARYHLLYGGIDSDGITERTGDMTAVMAAVAQRHATEVSCPIVRREIFFLPDEDRHLLGGIDMSVTPVVDKTVSFEITSENRRAPQTVSFQVALKPGSKTIRLAYTNEFWEGDGDNRDADRNLHLDQIEVRGSSGNVVTKMELESVEVRGDCPEDWQGENWFHMWGECSLEVPVDIPKSDDYSIYVRAYQDRAGDDPARLEISVESDVETSQGAKAIRNKLVELHEKLLGVTVTVDSSDVDAAFRLFVEVWEKGRPDWWKERKSYCRSFGDELEFDGLIDPPLEEYDWDRLGKIYGEVGFYEFHGGGLFRAWVVVLAYLLTDYRYLFL